MKLKILISLLSLSGLALAQSTIPWNSWSSPENPSPYPTPPVPFASPTPILPDPQYYGGPSPAEAAFNAKVMSIAKSYLGTENNSGDNEDPDRNVPNPKIEELAHSVFHADVPSEEFYGGWCDWFVTAILEKAGLQDITETMFGMLQMSKAHFVVTPIPGDIVLLAGHIAFYAGEDPSDGYIWILGGNQEYTSDANTVSHSNYSSYNYYSPGSDSHKKKPFEVHGLDIPHGSSTDSNDNGGIDVHVNLPKNNVKRGFGVNYAKVQRSDIQIIYRMNPPK